MAIFTITRGFALATQLGLKPFRPGTFETNDSVLIDALRKAVYATEVKPEPELKKGKKDAK